MTEVLVSSTVLILALAALRLLLRGRIDPRLQYALWLLAALRLRFDRVVLVDYQPTCENMLADFACRLRGGLPAGVELHALKLHETAASYAEWYADDNADRL